MKVIFIGSTNSSFEEVLKRMLEAFERGYNSIFVVHDGSHHASTYFFYVQKRGGNGGRIVRKPALWLEKTFDVCIRKDIMYFQCSREWE